MDSHRPINRRNKFKNGDYILTAEVAKALGISKTSLKTWLREKKIPEPAQRDERTGYRLWKVDEVAQLIQKHRRKDTLE
jgi:DNA-binding transcriptional MerR regulator